MIFVQLKVGSLDNFAYVIGDDQNHQGAIVDPSWDIDRILGTARDNGLAIQKVINTHSHPDHVEGNQEIAGKTGAKIVAHKLARVKKDLTVVDGDTITIGSIPVRVIHTPGHCPDHICLLFDGKVLTGDTLFVGECGRTDLPGGDAGQLFDSLFGKLMKLDDSVEVYPGHDYGSRPHSTIGYERENNYVLKPRTREEFIRFMAEP